MQWVRVKTAGIASAVLLASAMLFSCAITSFAAVLDAGTNGFTVKCAAVVPGAPADAYEKLVDVGNWWVAEHTWSGKSENLSIDARPGGCFCEKLENGGGVRHAEVVYADPGKTLRLSGELGPFQALGVSGALTFSFFPNPTGGTRVEMTYAVGGFLAGGFEALAPIVDEVNAGQLSSFAKHAGGALEAPAPPK